MNPDPKEIEQRVVSFYLRSRDYNGLSLSGLADDLGVAANELYVIVTDLATAGRISIVSPYQSNPFIKMIDAPIKEQIHDLDKRNPNLVCLYPSAALVRENVNTAEYDDRPFTRMLVLAAPKLMAVPFRLEVLDTYERDPRYWFRFYDFGGTISVQDEHRGQMDNSDRVDLRFGVGYDDREDRVVAVYLHHLGSLPGKQQRIWSEFLVERKARISEEYYKTTILAEPSGTMSVYEGIIHEQVEINKLFALMGRPHLFRETYEENRPRRFSFFVKPTRSHHNDFVLLLDKMLSENLDVSAFGEDIERYRRVAVGKGEFERTAKGSLSMLDDWLAKRYPKLAEERSAIVRPLRRVRNERQEPAHAITPDEYDKDLYTLQDQLVWDVYRALNQLRKLITMDSSISGYEPPWWDGRLKVKSY